MSSLSSLLQTLGIQSSEQVTMSSGIVTVGTFTVVRGQDYVDFCIKCGVPKEEAQKMLGARVTFHNELMNGGDKWVFSVTCDNMPGFNYVGTHEIGVPVPIDNKLLFCCGKGVVTVTKQGETGFLCTLESDATGVTEWTENYSGDGCAVEVVNKKTGATLNEFWTKVVNDRGWFKYSSDENAVKFFSAIGMPSEMLSNLKNMKLKMEKIGNIRVITEVYGGKVMVNCLKLDEEGDYITGVPSYDRRVLLTCLSPGKYKFIFKGVGSGQVQEWTFIFHDLGLECVGLDKTSGQTCKIIYLPCDNLTGTFKPLSVTGLNELGSHLGLNPDLITKMCTDYEGRLVVKLVEGSWLHTDYTSTVQPGGSMVCKLGEEFTHTLPLVPGQKNLRCIFTLNGDCLMGSMKGVNSHHFVTLMKFTENYLIQTTRLLGTHLQTKVIFERIL